MKSLGAWALRAFGLLIMFAAFGFAAVKAPDRPLESLVARWAPPPSDFVDLDGQLVHYRDEGPLNVGTGDTTPLVLIHGTSASLHTWEGWVKELSKERRVITFDLPGFGLSGASPQADYHSAAYVDFVRALLDHLKVQRVLIGGNSLGGEVAWQFADKYPQRVGALILVDAGGYAFEPGEVPGAFRLARMPVLKHLGRFLLPRQLVEKSVRNVYGDPDKVTPAVVDRYFEITLREGNREALNQRFEQLDHGGQAERIHHLRQPTLILWGEKDKLIPPQYGRDFARDIPGSQLVMFPLLGHVPQEEDPAATLAPVQAFLHSLGSGASAP